MNGSQNNTRKQLCHVKVATRPQEDSPAEARCLDGSIPKSMCKHRNACTWSSLQAATATINEFSMNSCWLHPKQSSEKFKANSTIPCHDRKKCSNLLRNAPNARRLSPHPVRQKRTISTGRNRHHPNDKRSSRKGAKDAKKNSEGCVIPSGISRTEWMSRFKTNLHFGFCNF